MKKHKILEEDGYALPAVLIILALLFGTTAILLSQQNMDNIGNKRFTEYQQCLLTAKGAIAEMTVQLEADENYIGSSGPAGDPKEGGTYKITVTKLPETTSGKTAWSYLIDAQYAGTCINFRGEAEADTMGRVEKVTRVLVK